MNNFCRLLLIILLSFLFDTASACHCSGYFEGVNSLKELEGYDFVARVAITSEKDYKTNSDSGVPGIGQLGIKVIEQFKGKAVDEIFEQSKNSSCDLGIEPGDEWIIFAKLRNGRLEVGACDRNVRYKDKSGMRDWQFTRGVRELDDLHRLYERRSKPLPDGISRQFYPTGKTELEETYSNGLKNGPRTVFYGDGTVWGRQSYVNDSLQGESVWYYPSGQLYVHRFFQNGTLVNVSRVYHDTTISAFEREFLIKRFIKTGDSSLLARRQIHVQLEVVYDHLGREILDREYSRFGKIISEWIIQPERNFATHIYYHENGQIKSIGYTYNHEDYGHYQEYSADGKPTRSQDYNESARPIQK